MRKFTLTAFVAATALIAACGESRTDELKRVAEMQVVSAQKDSLLKDMTATTAFLADISREISKVRNLKSVKNAANTDLEDNLTPDQRRARVLDQVREITARVALAENRLATSRKRVAELAGSDSEKTVRLAQYDSTVTAFKSIIDNQKTQLASITEQMNALAAENTQLKSDNAVLVSDRTRVTAQRDSLQTDRNTVYYIVGDRKSLEARHLIQRKGGFLGLGKTAVPAVELDKSEFTPIDRTMVSEIPLPRADRTYKIVSGQDVSAVESAVTTGKKGEVKGSFKITNHEQFWANSKYLIVIEQ